MLHKYFPLAFVLLSVFCINGCTENTVTAPDAHSITLSLGDLPQPPSGFQYGLWLSYPKNCPSGSKSGPLHGEVEDKFVSRFSISGGKALFVDDTTGLEARLGPFRFVQNALISLERTGEISEEPNMVLISGEITGTLNQGKAILSLNGHFAWSDEIDKTQGEFILASSQPEPAFRSSIYLASGSDASNLRAGLSDLPEPPEGSAFALWVFKAGGDTLGLGHFIEASAGDDAGPDEFLFPGGRAESNGTPLDLTSGEYSLAVTLWNASIDQPDWLLMNLTLLSAPIPEGLNSFSPASLTHRDLSRFRASITIDR